MSIPTRTRVPDIRRGDTITANPFLMSIVNQLNRGLDDFRPPKQKNQSLAPEEQSSEALTMSCDLVLENEYDLLVLKPDGNIAFVAKPPALYGSIASRTVNGEAQVIIPPYVVGDVIFALRVEDGGTRVASSELADGTFVLPEWQDLNVDARAWAEDDS